MLGRFVTAATDGFFTEFEYDQVKSHSRHFKSKFYSCLKVKMRREIWKQSILT